VGGPGSDHPGGARRPRGPADRGLAVVAPVSQATQKTAARAAAEEALLDAAERLLAGVGYAGVTTRRLAEEAGVNHGLVHYYFGSNENLLVRALERYTGRLIARQRELYTADMPFADKWRTAMRYLVSEDVRYQKIWLELQALAWNNPDIKARLAMVNTEWRAVLTEAFAEPRRELGIAMPLEALVALVMTFNLGIIVERLGGIETGHRELLDWIEQWITR
jgi:AcrR family transcriptional regulator